MCNWRPVLGLPTCAQRGQAIGERSVTLSGKMGHVVDSNGGWSGLVSNNGRAGLWISGTGRVLAQVRFDGGRVGPDDGVRELRSIEFGKR